ncbi:MAG: alpha/beta hydrolase [Actinomycetota bacterium]|nr:alpha/beta hydrolase [Actinomycetota bacterium]
MGQTPTDLSPHPGPRPRLVDLGAPVAPEGVVLVLHGGAARRGRSSVSQTQLSVLRMVPVARRVARAGEGRLAVRRLLNSHRGWDPRRTPVDDVAWALEQTRQRYGDLPVGLVGHSLGGRAALLSGGSPGVRSVVALNPWVYDDDDVDLTGRRVLLVVGEDDRVASPRRSLAVAARLGRRTQVDVVTVPGGKHAMLRHGGRFESAAADFTRRALLDG